MDIEYLLFTSDSVLIDKLFPEDNEILDKIVMVNLIQLFPLYWKGEEATDIFDVELSDIEN